MPLPFVGDHLKVRIGNTSDYYRSRLVDATDASYYIDVPLHVRTNHPLIVDPSEPFWVEFHAQDGSQCRFSASRTRLMNLPGLSWEIPKPSLKDVLREQRREFVRIRVDFPVTVGTSEQSVPPTTCHTYDISGGGMAIRTPRGYVLSPGKVVAVKFTLPRVNVAIDAKCFVVRVSDPGEQGQRIASLQFIDMPESVRKKIIQFTFTLQRLSV